MNFLRYDSPLSEGARFLGNLVILNLCYILCCLPVITIGPATAALFFAVYNDGDDSWPVRKFFRGFKENFLQGMGIWVLLTIPAAMIVSSFYFLGALQLPSYQIFQGFLLILLLVLACIQTMVYPLQSRYTNPIRQTLRNALIIGVCSPIPSILLFVLRWLPLLTFFLNLDIFTYVLTCWLVIGFALVAWIQSSIITKILKRILPDS